MNNKADDLFFDIYRIRSVEEEIASRYAEQLMRCPVHLSIGQEAAAVGVCSTLNSSDLAFSGHRSHAHYLAKGGNLVSMLAEIYGKSSGCCGGRGGSMHLSDLKAGFVASTPIVASTIPIAVGAALTAQREESGQVVVAFLGDGAMEAGVVHESLNFASTKSLPIIFVCENNLYSVYSPLSVRQPSNRHLRDLASSHGLESLLVDGNDVHQISEVVRSLLPSVRSYEGPVFLELPTYRWLEHCGPNYDNDIGYRSSEEFLRWKLSDPLLLASQKANIDTTDSRFDTIASEISNAFHQATSAHYPTPDEAAHHVYSPTSDIQYFQANTSRQISFADAIREAHTDCLRADPTTLLFGLGVPDPKGIFGTTTDLHKEFGSDRVFDIPLSEHALTGVALGASITGSRPVLTHQRLDFSLVSIDQIVNQAAKWYYMFNGAMCAPLVIRMIIGRGWGQGPQHSQSLHSWFAHIPGLKVVMPSTPFEAKGMLTAAIRDNNPVLFLEQRWLHSLTGYVPEHSYELPLDGTHTITSGTDVTLVSHSYGVIECISAVSTLSTYGIRCELIDLRSIRPLNCSEIVKSVSKTSRLLVVDHADATCGVSSEILAQITETVDNSLNICCRRLTFPPHPCPTSPSLAQGYYSRASDIVLSVLAMFGRSPEFNNLPDENNFGDQPSPSFTGPF